MTIAALFDILVVGNIRPAAVFIRMILQSHLISHQALQTLREKTLDNIVKVRYHNVHMHETRKDHHVSTM